jgi:rhamnosyltransferase
MRSDTRDQPKIVAGIVTFNPDATRLGENIDAISGQVEAVVVVDNGSSSTTGISPQPSVHVIENDANRGIAAALNQIVQWASDQHADAVVLLDQDSVLEDGTVVKLTRSLAEGVAIAAPQIADRNLGSDRPRDTRDVNYCITSGSLLAVDSWRQVDGYDDHMFIDFVDFDFCLRIREAGLRIVQVGDARILHEIGHAQRAGKRIAYNHSSFRLRHMAQDMVYYARKHRRAPRELRVGGRGLLLTYAVLARKAAITLVYETDRLARAGAILRGTIAGTFAKLA